MAIFEKTEDSDLDIYKKGDYYLHHTTDEHPRDEMFPTHAHRYCELFYCIAGKGIYTVEGTDYPFSPGTVMLMRYGEVHKLHIDTSERYERIVLHFPMSVFDDTPWSGELAKLYTDRPLGKGNMFKGGDEQTAYIERTMRNMCRENVTDEAERVALMNAGLMAVLSELRGITDDGGANVPKPLAEGDAISNEIVSSVIAYINDHLTEDWTLGKLESKFFFSKSYLNRAFKMSTGSSVWDYVVMKRLLVARALLREGKSANEASEECGFRDYSSFYRQYKKRFGVSPSSDRRSQEKNRT